MRTLPLFAVPLILFAALPGFSQHEDGTGDGVRCECVADVWISAFEGEQTNSMGRTGVLKLKGYGEWALMRFDVSKLKGREVLSAKLFMHGARPWLDLSKGTTEEIEGQRYKVNSLRRIGVSTVGTGWNEGMEEKDYREDPAGHGATFLEAEFGREPWAWEGSSNLSDVILGNGNSIVCHPELAREPGGDGRWFSVSLDVDIVRAMVCGATDGIAVVDESGQTMENNFIHSRETKGFEPYILVELGGEDTAAPKIPDNLAVVPARLFAGEDAGAAMVGLLPAFDDAFAGFVRVNGKPWPRWKTPFPGSGKPLVLDGLFPGEAITVSIEYDDGRGNRTEPIVLAGNASGAKPAPAPLPDVTAEQARLGGEPTPIRGGLKVWAAPDIVAVCPQTGKIFHGADGGADFRQANPVWNGKTDTVKLFGCRGEFVAFQLVVEGEVSGLEIAGGPFKSANPARNGTIDCRWSVLPEWYVETATKKQAKTPLGKNRIEGGWIPELALPPADVDAMREKAGVQAKGIVIPDPLNGVPDQKNQSVWCEFYIPKDAAPGAASSELVLNVGGLTVRTVPVSLTVYDFQMPDELSFDVMMNMYLAQGDTLFDLYREAHRHRLELHRVGMGTNISGSGDWFEPAVEKKDGGYRVTDWAEYDAKFGPILDGSLFKDLPRGPIPVRTFRAPFSEDWPVPHEIGYPYREPYYRDLLNPKKTSPAWMVETHHAMTGPNVGPEAYTEEYRDGVASVVRDYILHAEEKGWSRTRFQVMPNSKIYYRNQWTTTAMWRYDEPMFRDDYLASRVQAGFFRDGVRRAAETLGVEPGVLRDRFVFRQDISRPEWIFDALDYDGGKGDRYLDLILVGGYWESHRLERARRLRERLKCDVGNYTSFGEVGGNNAAQSAVCLMSWLTGCDATLQWLTVRSVSDLADGDRALVKPDRLAMFVRTNKWNHREKKYVQEPGFVSPVLVSVRAKGLRRGQQDVEIARALTLARNIDRETAARLLRDYAGAGARNQVAEVFEEAVGVNFDDLDVAAMMRLREAMLKELGK